MRVESLYRSYLMFTTFSDVCSQDWILIATYPELLDISSLAGPEAKENRRQTEHRRRTWLSIVGIIDNYTLTIVFS